MANKFRGEVPLQAGEVTYTLRFSANALCELEELLGMGINQIGQQLSSPEKMRMKTVITMIWVGLKDRHPDITMAQAGEIITDATLIKAMEAISAGFIATFGKPDEVPLQPGRKSPAKQNADGIGKVS